MNGNFSETFFKLLICFSITVTGKSNENCNWHRIHSIVFEIRKSNKNSAVAEMGDRLATIYMGRKVGAAVPLFFGGSWLPI